ncbi:uncharacterized protein PHACADRAFT_255147 [Phanerochaete carnosa HHB-10118-sp]|uniref:Uncharacterized protein n=1 Tax=Phanerochaete carnosa (strain HHB-10118-sp) TaxID=650164 RepID=K5W703_PHACS|nr:uncharacterized protein PHACADRAFT_255147 [Phanerochaete carnosa HHB-10118-sp]EKM54930.1 hypothetical protein PHACADRAFT_255147 [Phanerochaete carnosa HHB-10118-sp]
MRELTQLNSLFKNSSLTAFQRMCPTAPRYRTDYPGLKGYIVQEMGNIASNERVQSSERRASEHWISIPPDAQTPSCVVCSSCGTSPISEFSSNQPPVPHQTLIPDEA